MIAHSSLIRSARHPMMHHRLERGCVWCLAPVSMSPCRSSFGCCSTGLLSAAKRTIPSSCGRVYAVLCSPGVEFIAVFNLFLSVALRILHVLILCGLLLLRLGSLFPSLVKVTAEVSTFCTSSGQLFLKPVSREHVCLRQGQGPRPGGGARAPHPHHPHVQERQEPREGSVILRTAVPYEVRVTPHALSILIYRDTA